MSDLLLFGKPHSIFISTRVSSLRIELQSHISNQHAVNLFDLPDPTHCLLNTHVLIYGSAEIKYAISHGLNTL